jgi:hypothetical protein
MLKNILEFPTSVTKESKWLASRWLGKYTSLDKMYRFFLLTILQDMLRQPILLASKVNVYMKYINSSTSKMKEIIL